MKISETQLRLLKLLLQQRSKPLTAMDFLKQSWAKQVSALALFSVTITLCFLCDQVSFAVFLSGYLVGIIARDVQLLQNKTQILLLCSEVANWERVEQLIRENEPSKA
jgi:hypothetical protein